MTTRRDFMKSTAAVTAASIAGIAGFPKFTFGQSSKGKTFIKIFQRGGADGLHLFPPTADSFYYQYRPDIAIEPPSGDKSSAISLGHKYRSMNPNLELLMEIWDAGRMTVMPSTSFAGAGRSHFSNQRWIGNGGSLDFADGYLNRYLQNVASPANAQAATDLRALVAGKTSLGQEFTGKVQVPVIQSNSNYKLENGDFCTGPTGCDDNRLTEYMREIASHDVVESEVDGAIRENQVVLLDSIEQITKYREGYQSATNGLKYSDSRLGHGLKLCAELLKGGAPLEVASLDWTKPGWDSHNNQIPLDGNPFLDGHYNTSTAEGAADLLAFYRDLGPLMDDVVVLVVAEFGRTVKQNGSRGTDHGGGGAWFCFGGPSKSQIAPDITTLDDTVLEKNWLPLVTHFQDIVGEIMLRHMNVEQAIIEKIFPGHQFTDLKLFESVA